MKIKVPGTVNCNIFALHSVILGCFQIQALPFQYGFVLGVSGNAVFPSELLY